MEPWYKVATPRKEVREGRSFNPDEFAIALEQVVAGTAPEDYRKPEQFFSRTCFTRALREHAGMVLRRLSGRTENTAPVLTLITQFGGGKTHTLTALYHLATNGDAAMSYSGIADLVRVSGSRFGAEGASRRVRRQCVGSARGSRESLDRHSPPTCGR
jgi:predicted AAA+ superfamily ATPase